MAHSTQFRLDVQSHGQAWMNELMYTQDTDVVYQHCLMVCKNKKLKVKPWLQLNTNVIVDCSTTHIHVNEMVFIETVKILSPPLITLTLKQYHMLVVV